MQMEAGILILLHQNGCLGTPATSAYDPFPSVAPSSAFLVNTLKELHRQNVLMGSFNGITPPSARIPRDLRLRPWWQTRATFLHSLRPLLHTVASLAGLGVRAAEPPGSSVSVPQVASFHNPFSSSPLPPMPLDPQSSEFWPR